MRKTLLGFLMSGLCLTGFAQVAAPEGAVSPVASTADEPVWYAMMSSHLTEAERQNRWMYYDGERVATEKYDAGLAGVEDLTDYAWRLEENADGSVRLVHYDGVEISVPAEATAEDGSSNVNTPLVMQGEGASWTMQLSSGTGLSNQCAEGQWCFDYTGYAGDGHAFLNALDAQQGKDSAFGLTIYAAGVHQASGWFFVPLTIEEETPAEEWLVIESNTLSSATYGGVDLTGLMYMNGSISTSISGGVLEGMPYCCDIWGADGQGCYLFVPVEIPRDGTYKFSFRARLNQSNNGTADIVLRYDDSSFNAWSATDCSPTYTLNDSEVLPAQVYESDRLELTAGTYYMGLANTASTNVDLGTNLFVGDFQLSWLNDGSVQSHLVNVVAGEGGTVMVLDGKTPVASGASVIDGTELTITATPAEDYELASLTVNGDDFENGGTWVVNGEVNVEATFTKVVRYSVTWDVENGTIEVSDQNYTTVNEGDKVLPGTVITINAVPANGYELELLTVNGTEIENGSDWEVTDDVHIVAVMVGTGLAEVATGGVYYDSQAQLLRVNGRQALEIYDVTGRKVVGTAADGAYSVAGLRAGIYMAVVDGKVVKFRK